ncbi:Suppressor of kinetochore protein 1 [Aphelenchoides avenae]|nr:Suppressor of kinetochore protein 1 [Aphelenchus avenae]
MSSLSVNNTAGPRQVICETSDMKQIHVEADVLRFSRTFDKMCRALGLGEHDNFPGIFRVPTISSRMFRKVIGWCKGHKGQLCPFVRRDPLTQECQWFRVTKYERTFFGVPVQELLELVMAASYLDINYLYEYGCQAIAALIKDKSPTDIRHILRQEGDLSPAEYAEIRDANPWLDPTTARRCHGMGLLLLVERK